MTQKILILGAGAWGTAVSQLLADNGHSVTLWSFESDVADHINTKRSNHKYLPDVMLSERIAATADLGAALAGATWIFCAVPSTHLRSVLSDVVRLSPAAAAARWVMMTKGIEQQTDMLPIFVLQDVFAKAVQYAVLSGPNFAVELVQRVPTATTVASTSQTLLQDLSVLLINHYFKVFFSDDPKGVQLGGALKNVIAVIVGIAAGAGYAHENTRAYLITEGLAELAKLTEALGGTREAIYGLSGLGDLLLTCSSSLSKNLRAGVLIGKGLSLEQIKAEYFPVLPEGINTLKSIHSLINRTKIDLPLCSIAYEYVFNGRPFKDVFDYSVTQNDGKKKSSQGLLINGVYHGSIGLVVGFLGFVTVVFFLHGLFFGLFDSTSIMVIFNIVVCLLAIYVLGKLK